MENKIDQNVQKFHEKLTIFSNIIETYPRGLLAGWIIYTISYYILIYTLRDEVIRIFNIFQNSPFILSKYYASIVFLFYHPNFTEIGVILAFGLGFLYLIVSTENQGHMLSVEETQPAKQTQANLLLLSLFNFAIILPYIAYLHFVNHSDLEILLVFIAYIVSVGFAALFTKFCNIMQDYNELEKLCKNFQIIKSESPNPEISKFFYLINGKQGFRNCIILFMVICILPFSEFSLNFLTLVYLELCSLVWLFIILSLTFPGGPVKGPVNIFFNSGQIFNRVFIIEESAQGYINTLHKGNNIKKVITNSIKYIEASDENFG